MRFSGWSGLFVFAASSIVACGDAGSTPPAATNEGVDAGTGAQPGPPDPSSTGPSGTDAGGATDAQPLTTSGNAYDHNGTITWQTRVEHLSNAGHDFDVKVYAPDSPGLHPAVSISSGSTQSGEAYVPYAERLASYGITVIVRDDPGALTASSAIVDDLIYVIGTWMPSALAGSVDVTRVGLTGHSRGGGVSLYAAEQLKGKVAAWFGLDPVDNQFLINPGVFARQDLKELTIPTAYLGAEVTSNCAPASDNYETLFPKTPSPSVLILGKGAGHTQLELQSKCAACNMCSPSGTANADVVLAYSIRYLTAFFARELLHDATVGPKFEGAGGPADDAKGLVSFSLH